MAAPPDTDFDHLWKWLTEIGHYCKITTGPRDTWLVWCSQCGLIYICADKDEAQYGINQHRAEVGMIQDERGRWYTPRNDAA